jgi:hypothetical protein
MLDKHTMHDPKVQIPAGIDTKCHGCNMQQSEKKR